MKFEIALHTEVGIRNRTNEDSMCIKQARTTCGDVLMAVICDGMGGLASGEVASGTVVTTFCEWFEQALPSILEMADPVDEIRYQWDRLIRSQNQMIGAYGQKKKIRLGTTITAILFLADGTYLISHVGDSRAYYISNQSVRILTEDHSKVAMLVKSGEIRAQDAERHPDRNVLTQCIGASRIVKPAFYMGKAQPGECYMLCSDGFRHEITPVEIREAFAPDVNPDEDMMKEHLVRMVQLNMDRGETDNISVVLIKVS